MVQTRTEPTPTPARPVSAPPAARTASIGASMVIKGEIFSKEELFVDGEIEGTLESHDRLTIGPNGRIRASVKAREVVVQGNIRGNVTALERLTIRKEANLVGDVKTAGIVIEDGAYFKGSIDILKGEPERREAQASKLAPAKDQPPVVVRT